MKISGSNVVPFPVETVWDAILDPRVLVATIPGCEQLAATGENAYDMTVTAGVAAIKGTYQGSCTLSDLESNESLVMHLSGAGAPGTIDATVKVFFGEAEPGVTKIDYQADAVVGGMVGGVGQRMLTSVSKRMAGEFFGNVASAIASPAVNAPMVEQVSTGSTHDVVETPAASQGAVYARSGVSTSSTNGDGDFLKGIAVGAGLVLLGVIAGSVLGRRR
jgi:carbon monoxide dehydrogenase subunit G